KVVGISTKHIREKIVVETPKDFANLYERCWSSDPGKRPTLNEVSIVLEK
ncbi:26349_t:CDS:1, partial [Racocetra persica]